MLFWSQHCRAPFSILLLSVGCAGTTEINRLQKLQSRAARIVTNSSFDTPSNQLIVKLGWKTVNELIDIDSKTMVFKSLNELAPPYLRSLFRNGSQHTHIDYAIHQQTSGYQKRYRKQHEMPFV